MNLKPDTQEQEVKLDSIRLIKGIWPFIRPCFWMLAACCAVSGVITALDLLVPWLTRMAIDGFILPVDPGTGVVFLGFSITRFRVFALIYLSVLILTLVIDFFQTMALEYTGQKIIFNLRCTLFSHMTGLDVPFFDENTSGRLVSRVAGDVENMNDMFSTILVFIFKDLVLMAGILAVMFSMNSRLAAYTVLIVPAIVISISVSSLFIRRAFRTIRQKLGEINHMFTETLGGIKVIQTLRCEPFFDTRFRELNQEHFRASLYQIRAFAVFMPLISFLGVLGVAIVIYGGSLEVVARRLTIGEIVAFLFYVKLFFRPLRELSEKFSLLQNALASGERIVSILERPPAPARRSREYPPGRPPALSPIRSVAFERVCFSYEPDRPVLQDLSFTIRSGQSIGIVGRTGAGKSTIINLINGFYSPDSGRILINGIDQGTYAIRDIRERTAMVMQDPILFSGTIRENLAPESARIPDDRFKHALIQANCAFLFENRQGLDTVLYERGNPLSSGEKQLVCIARAFARNPDLIIFDEATSYMDSATEITIHDALAKLMENRTAVIIAHRLSTVRNCDCIYLIRDGRIRESGTHLELTNRKGEYYHLLEKEQILSG